MFWDVIIKIPENHVETQCLFNFISEILWSSQYNFWRERYYEGSWKVKPLLKFLASVISWSYKYEYCQVTNEIAIQSFCIISYTFTTQQISKIIVSCVSKSQYTYKNGVEQRFVIVQTEFFCDNPKMEPMTNTEGMRFNRKEASLTDPMVAMLK